MQTAARDAKEYKQQRYYTQHVVIMWWYNGWFLTVDLYRKIMLNCIQSNSYPPLLKYPLSKYGACCIWGYLSRSLFVIRSLYPVAGANECIQFEQQKFLISLCSMMWAISYEYVLLFKMAEKNWNWGWIKAL
jgi:hypothetical protein